MLLGSKRILITKRSARSAAGGARVHGTTERRSGSQNSFGILNGSSQSSSPSPKGRGGTAQCRHSLTTTYYRRCTEESLADLRRQAEEHHRDCKPAPFPRDDSSGDRGALCQEYNRAPHACTSLETYTSEALICDLVSDIVSVPGSTSVSVEHSPQTSTWNHEELTRTTYTQPGSSIPNTLHNTSRLPEQ